MTGQNVLPPQVVTAIGPTIQTVSTGADGRFSFPALTPGRYRVIVHVASTLESSRAIETEVAGDDDRELASLSFQPVGKVAARVVHGDAPVGAALIGAQGDVSETVTDGEGRFTLARLPVGTRALFVVRSGFVPRIIEGVDVTWGETTTLPDVALADDPVVLTSLSLEASVVGVEDREGIVATIGATDAGPTLTATSDAMGRIVLQPLQSGLYALELSHARGVLRLPRLFFGDGHAFLVDAGLAPLGPLRISAGRRVASGRYAPGSISSPLGTYVVMDGGVYDVSPIPTLRFSLSSLGLAEPEVVGFLADESWLIVRARSANDARRYSLYRVAPGVWTPEWLRDVDEVNGHLLPLQRSFLFADRVDAESRSLYAQLQSIDDPTTVQPIGEISLAGLVGWLPSSASGRHALIATAHLTRMVRLADGVTVGWAEGLARWHPDYELVVFHGVGYSTLDERGEVTQFGDALPSGPGWQVSGPGLSFGPTNGLRTADHERAYGFFGTSLVQWDVASGVPTPLDTTCPFQPEPLLLFADETRLAYRCLHDGLTYLRLLDLSTGVWVEVASIVGEVRAAGTRLFFLDAAYTLRSVAFDGGDLRSLLKTVSTYVVDPTGRWAAGLRGDGCVTTGCSSNLWLVDAETGGASQLAEQAGLPRFLSSSVLEYVRNTSADGGVRGLYFVAVPL